mmetsp:Transcript_15621/g.43682  ORF Transcript_15621/g.43682 Transcript_15621/m.43682 type:complete len:177 (+) Transcript_15621:319-849(+)
MFCLGYRFDVFSGDAVSTQPRVTGPGDSGLNRHLSHSSLKSPLTKLFNDVSAREYAEEAGATTNNVFEEVSDLNIGSLLDNISCRSGVRCRVPCKHYSEVILGTTSATFHTGLINDMWFNRAQSMSQINLHLHSFANPGPPKLEIAHLRSIHHKRLRASCDEHCLYSQFSPSCSVF